MIATMHYFKDFPGFFGLGGGLTGAGFGFLILLLLAWSLVWKGLALWQAARKGEKIWFVVFLAVNTLGILEILYLYVFSRKAKPVPPQNVQV